MSALYPVVEAAVIAACLTVVLFASVSFVKEGGLWPAMGRGAAAFGWFLVVWELARAGAFEGTRDSARTTQIAAAAVSLGMAWAVVAARRVRPLTADLVALQAGRMVAIVVLIALAGEALPAWLALPIGLGDSLVGLAALGVARGLRTAAPGTAGRAPLWNLAGAVLATFTIIAPIAASRSTGYFFSLYPLALFPTFLAPCALLLHLLALGQLRRPSPPGSTS